MKTMTATQLNQKLNEDTVLLIDVREPAEYRSESIPGAILMPLSDISQAKIPSTEKTIVIHCRSGHRSAAASEKLQTQDPTLDICVLEGGILAWKQAGFPVKNSGKSVLPIDAQVRIIAGIFVLFGVTLGSWFHPGFHLVSAFVGAGLIFSGLTGYCGMAKLLAKMPWNQ